MAEHVQRPEIGAVGARLLYPDDTIQHGGVVLGAGLGRIAAHAFRGFTAEHPGVAKQLQLTRNYSCVTGACLLARRAVFMEVGGFDEQRLPVTFNDVDFCLRLREGALQIIWRPYADLIHHESASRGRDFGSPERAQLLREADYMQKKWGERLRRDPFYSPNLSQSLVFALAWPPRIPLLRDSVKSAAEKVFTAS